LRIRRGLSDPQQPQTLRDVSISLDNVGGVEKARGNLDAASAAYGESLRIRRGLSDPQQPQTLRDVSVSLERVGWVEEGAREPGCRLRRLWGEFENRSRALGPAAAPDPA